MNTIPYPELMGKLVSLLVGKCHIRHKLLEMLSRENVPGQCIHTGKQEAPNTWENKEAEAKAAAN